MIITVAVVLCDRCPKTIAVEGDIEKFAVTMQKAGWVTNLTEEFCPECWEAQNESD